MKKVIILINFTFFMFFFSSSYAQEEPIPITAEEAFDAVQMYDDVALVDVRSRAEYYWVGAASQVDEIITTKGLSIVPDLGKVLVGKDGRFLEFHVDGSYKRLNTKKISEVKLSPIAINIPYKLWNEDSGKLEPNDEFVNQVNTLPEAGYKIVIFFCRSGERSEDCVDVLPLDLLNNFEGIYEIDQPDGQTGNGGFEGTSYGNIYNGYRGFPNRMTDIQEHPSVSWKDTGLPIKTSVNPVSSQ